MLSIRYFFMQLLKHWATASNPPDVVFLKVRDWNSHHLLQNGDGASGSPGIAGSAENRLEGGDKSAPARVHAVLRVLIPVYPGG